MTLKEFLISKYGFDEAKAESILTQSRMKSSELVSSKLDELFSFLDFDENDQKKAIGKWPHILNMSPENIKGKADFFKNEYGITLAQFRKMVKVNFSPVNAAETKVLEIEDYYSKHFGMTRGQFVAKMRHTPGLIGLSMESVDKKNEYVAQKFSMTYSDIEKLVKSGSNYPCISIEKIDELADFFFDEFGITPDKFGKMLVSGKPITYTKEKIMDAYEYLHKNYKISRDDYGEMISRCSTMLGLAPETIGKRIEKLQELGFETSDIVSSSRVLTLNSDKIKTRYVLAMLNGMSDSSFLSKGFMYDDKTIAQRMIWLKSQGKDTKHLYDSQKKFVKFANHDEIDISTIPIDIQKFRMEMLNEYNTKFMANMTISEEELND